MRNSNRPYTRIREYNKPSVNLSYHERTILCNENTNPCEKTYTLEPARQHRPRPKHHL